MSSKIANVNRSELIRMFVLNVISDDYEDLEMILEAVRNDGQRAGMAIGEPDVLAALTDLIRDGFATAYRLFPTKEPPQEISGVPPVADLTKYHYWVTDKGRAMQVSEYKDWPFDDSGDLRKDWNQPQH